MSGATLVCSPAGKPCGSAHTKLCPDGCRRQLIQCKIEGKAWSALVADGHVCAVCTYQASASASILDRQLLAASFASLFMTAQLASFYCVHAQLRKLWPPESSRMGCWPPSSPCLQLVAACTCAQTPVQGTTRQACPVCSAVPAVLCLPCQARHSYAQGSGQTAQMHPAPCSFRGLGGGHRRRSSSGGDLKRAGSAAQPAAASRSHSRSSSTGAVEVQALRTSNGGVSAPEGSGRLAADENTPQLQAETVPGGWGNQGPCAAGPQTVVETPGC